MTRHLYQVTMLQEGKYTMFYSSKQFYVLPYSVQSSPEHHCSPPADILDFAVSFSHTELVRAGVFHRRQSWIIDA